MNIISTEGDMYLNSDSIDSSKRSVWEICERKIIHEVRRVQYLSISFTQRARKITYQYLLYAHPYPPLPKPLSLSNLSHPSVTCCDTPEPLRKLSEILNLVFKSGEGWLGGGLAGDSGTMLSSIFMSYYALRCAEPEQISTFPSSHWSDLMASWNLRRSAFALASVMQYPIWKKKGFGQASKRLKVTTIMQSPRTLFSCYYISPSAICWCYWV